MISELIEEACRNCGNHTLSRIGRDEDDFDLIDGALCETDSWIVQCSKCGAKYGITWQAWPIW